MCTSKYSKKFGALLLLFSCSVVFNSLLSQGLHHDRLLCPSLSPKVCSNSRPLSRWCYRTISSSAIPFSSCPQPYPASGSFPVNGLFKSGGQSIGVSAPVLSTNVHGWFPLKLIGLISLLSKGLGPWVTIIWGIGHYNVWFMVLLLSASLHGDLV